MNKALSETHIRSKKNIIAYIKLLNYCVKFLRKNEEKYANLNEKNVNDNRQLWRGVKGKVTSRS